MVMICTAKDIMVLGKNKKNDMRLKSAKCITPKTLKPVYPVPPLGKRIR